jgi:hypothetical protein
MTNATVSEVEAPEKDPTGLTDIGSMLLNVVASQPDLDLTTVDEVLDGFMSLDVKGLLNYGGRPHLVQYAQFLASIKSTYPNRLRAERKKKTVVFDQCLAAIARAPAVVGKKAKKLGDLSCR